MILAIIFFIAYSCVCFFAPNFIWVSGFATFNLILSLIFYKQPLKTLKYFIRMLILSAIIFGLNYAFEKEILTSLLVGLKVLTVAYFGILFSKIFTPALIADGISQLLFPLKLFKIDTNAIALTIVIALSFMSVLSSSAKNLTKALKARGFRFTLKNIFTQGHMIFMLYFSEIFKRVDAIELALLARGYSANENKKGENLWNFYFVQTSQESVINI